MPTMGLNNPDFAYEMVVLPICPKSALQEKNIMIFILCSFLKASARTSLLMDLWPNQKIGKRHFFQDIQNSF